MKILYCLPDQLWIEEMRGGAPKDAAHIQQRYIADGLRARGHDLTYLAPRDLERSMVAPGDDALAPAAQTWTAAAWFDLAAKFVWRVQKALGIPYLNVFSNWRREDAVLQTLPGHDLAEGALYVRSHYDTVSASFNDAPNRDEVLVCWAFATRGRLNARLGGLKAKEVKGLDGLV